MGVYPFLIKCLILQAHLFRSCIKKAIKAVGALTKPVSNDILLKYLIIYIYLNHIVGQKSSLVLNSFW